MNSNSTLPENKNIIDTENKTKDLKFYSQKAIGIATFFGGPLAAGYLIRENYLSLKKPEEGRKSLIIGIAFTIVLFGGLFMIPESIINKVPSQILPLIYSGIIYLIVERIHGTILNQHKKYKNEFFSNWKAAGVGFLSLLVLSIGIFGYIFLAPEGQEYEMYNAKFEKFAKNETQTLVFYEHLETKTNYSLIKELDNSVIPKWKKNIEIIKESNKIKNLPSELLDQNKLLLKYSELRLEAFILFKKAIKEDNDKYANELETIHIEINTLLEKLN